MEILVFFVLFLFSNSLTAKYYSECMSDAPTGKDKFLMASDCTKYSYNNSHCCLFFYDNKDDSYTYSFSLFRNLNERVNFCLGISKDGYDHIDKVIKELKIDSGIETFQLNCSKEYLKFFLFYIIFIIIVIL